MGQNREVVVGILSIEIAFDRSCLCPQDNAIRNSFGNLVLEKHYLVTNLVHEFLLSPFRKRTLFSSCLIVDVRNNAPRITTVNLLPFFLHPPLQFYGKNHLFTSSLSILFYYPKYTRLLLRVENPC